MLVNAILFGSVLIIILFLSLFLRSLKFEKDKKDKKEKCKYKICDLKFKTTDTKKIAIFNVTSIDKNTFFIDFPVYFKFYSDYRFKAKVKIHYTTPGDNDKEEILNKIIKFESKSKEHKYYINDIIMGKITIEIEVKPEYGYPIIEFGILENPLCEITSDHKLEIIFPK